VHVRYSYLAEQFAEIDDLLDTIAAFVKTGDFTLGAELSRFEQRFASLIGVAHAIGVGSGTDALKLPLKALGIGPGDEVITAANTFIATVGAIAEVGARPVFVDCGPTFCLDVDQLERAITPHTRAIMPVHFTGYMTDMPRLLEIAARRGLPVIEDACQAILADLDGRRAGTFGLAAGFSLHPLKNLNVWGDGGVIVTADDALAEKLRLLRNHGLKNRDEVVLLGCNSRLDTLQAVVGNWLIGSAESITQGRIERAAYYDASFARVPQLTLPPRPTGQRAVYHLYVVHAEDRDGLHAHCQRHGVEAKIHYPIPLYRQEALQHLGYRRGDFPVADAHAESVISFPCDQHLSVAQQDRVVEVVREYYGVAAQ
jgi:dTDP-3-amino-2,3,6-trideoxy-4-keto-D-glucose/dTDP-3-amino-3,4,6-trideoxy-alpha-D-glucose/dTDP-2,6-dideoxy-D-kanosamine transaminase